MLGSCQRPEKLWNIKAAVIPMVGDALGTVPKTQVKRLGELDIRGRIETIMTTAMLKSARVLGRVLEISRNLSSLILQ